MPIGTLDRSALDRAPTLWDTYLELNKKLSPIAERVVKETATDRDTVTQEIAQIANERRIAVEKRDADERQANEGEKLSLGFKNDVERATKELSSEKFRLQTLKTSEAEGLQRRDQAVKAARQQEEEMAKLMGQGDMQTPWSDAPVPELSPEIRSWAANFVQLKKAKTIAYFKAESEKFGALIDLHKARKEIVASEARITDLEEQIAYSNTQIEVFDEATQRARNARQKNHEDVLALQQRIDAKNRILETFTYAEHLQQLVGDALEAALAAVRGARDEVEANLTTILGEVRSAKHDVYPNDVQKKFTEFENTWATRSKAIKGLRFGKDVKANIGLIDVESKLIQTFATEVDKYIANDLKKKAANTRLKNLREIWRPKIIREVVDRRNTESGLTILTNQLSINDDVIKEIGESCDPSLAIVPEDFVGPLEIEVERVYSRVQDEYLEKKLKDSNDLVEKARLETLDAVGNEPEFSQIKEARRKTTIAPYKAMPKESVTLEDVREALREELKLQGTPSKARWRKILGLPSKVFFDAKSFTDSAGVTYDVHISFFESCLGPSTAEGIGLFKSEGQKYAPDEVVDLIFKNGIDFIFRAHASVELKDKSEPKPHWYYGDSYLYFEDTFNEKIKITPGHDTNWCAKAKAHAKHELGERMNKIKDKVKAWLDSDGAI